MLDWFKWWDTLPETTRTSMHEARVAAEEAKNERSLHLQQQRAFKRAAEDAEKLRYQGMPSRQ